MKSLTLLSLAFILAACSQQPGDNASVATAPTETADEFVARINDELAELSRENGAAEWVRSTYITADTAILASKASERYAEWHSRNVKASMAYDGMELAPQTRRALDLLKLARPRPHRTTRRNVAKSPRSQPLSKACTAPDSTAVATMIVAAARNSRTS